MNINLTLQEMDALEAQLNFQVLTFPATSNTISLWREVKYPLLGQADKLAFIEHVDKVIFKRFQTKLEEQYKSKLTYKDLKIELRFEIDPKHLQSVIETELKQETQTLVNMFAMYQAQVEYSYDLLRRLHTYNIWEFKEPNLKHFGYEKKTTQKFYSKYLDKMMNSILINVQEISTETIKQFCATSLIKNNSLIESGKSFLKQFLFSGPSILKKISNLNVGLLIGGIVAEAVISKVGQKMLAQTLQNKFEQLFIHLQEMTNLLMKLNFKLEEKILATVAVVQETEQWAQHKADIAKFLLQNYRINIDDELIYCPETASYIQVKDDGNAVVLSNVDYQLDVVDEGDFSIIRIAQRDSLNLQKPQVALQLQQSEVLDSANWGIPIKESGEKQQQEVL